MQAFADHGEVEGDKVSGTADQAQAVLDRLAALGIDYDDVVEVLETRGRARSSTPPGASWSRPCRPRSTRPRQGKPDPGASKADDADGDAE